MTDGATNEIGPGRDGSAPFGPSNCSATGTLWTLIARCQVCGKELNRATHVPERERGRVIIAAPLMAICDVRSHNTLSDCNIGVDLEWVSESPNSVSRTDSEAKDKP